MGINNTVMYEKVCKARAKQQVALECLSYHATAPDSDVNRLKVRRVPSSRWFSSVCPTTPQHPTPMSTDSR